MVIGSGFHGSSVAQNLGTGQRNALTATSSGRGDACGTAEETICKLPDQFVRRLPSNDADAVLPLRRASPPSWRVFG
jgi:hypothetical protein